MLTAVSTSTEPEGCPEEQLRRLFERQRQRRPRAGCVHCSLQTIERLGFDAVYELALEALGTCGGVSILRMASRTVFLLPF